MRKVLASLLALPLALVACGGAAPESHSPMPRAEPAASQGGGGLACDLPQGNTSLRVAALPLAERNELQSSLINGPIAVRMEGCRLVQLDRCRGRSSASYTATPAETKLTLSAESDVLRDVPAASERLVPIVRAGHAVEVSLIGAGRFDYDPKTLDTHFDEGACQGATHVVIGYWVGALAIEEQGGAEIERSGDRNGCARASASPNAPPSGCSDLLTLDLAPIKELVAAMTAPPPPPRHTRGPTGDGGGGESMAEGGSTGDKKTGQGKGGFGGCDPNDPLCLFARSRSTAP